MRKGNVPYRASRYSRSPCATPIPLVPRQQSDRFCYLRPLLPRPRSSKGQTRFAVCSWLDSLTLRATANVHPRLPRAGRRRREWTVGMEIEPARLSAPPPFALFDQEGERILHTMRQSMNERLVEIAGWMTLGFPSLTATRGLNCTMLLHRQRWGHMDS
jgi:hypothetical protein